MRNMNNILKKLKKIKTVEERRNYTIKLLEDDSLNNHQKIDLLKNEFLTKKIVYKDERISFITRILFLKDGPQLLKDLVDYMYDFSSVNNMDIIFMNLLNDMEFASKYNVINDYLKILKYIVSSDTEVNIINLNYTNILNNKVKFDKIKLNKTQLNTFFNIFEKLLKNSPINNHYYGKEYILDNLIFPQNLLNFIFNNIDKDILKKSNFYKTFVSKYFSMNDVDLLLNRIPHNKEDISISIYDWFNINSTKYYSNNVNSFYLNNLKNKDSLYIGFTHDFKNKNIYKLLYYVIINNKNSIDIEQNTISLRQIMLSYIKEKDLDKLTYLLLLPYKKSFPRVLNSKPFDMEGYMILKEVFNNINSIINEEKDEKLKYLLLKSIKNNLTDTKIQFNSYKKNILKTVKNEVDRFLNIIPILDKSDIDKVIEVLETQRTKNNELPDTIDL